MPHTHYRTKGIFLKKEPKFEADQLFTVFTEDFGRLEVLGRAIRKIKSKLRPGAELFYFSEIEFIQGKNYKTLTDALLIDKFKDLRQNPTKLEIAYQIASAVDTLTGRQERDGKTWGLLTETLQAVNNKLRPTAHNLLPSYFLWNLFSILGYAPQVYHCAGCGKELLPETLFFVPQEGGVTCWQCLSKLKKEWAAEQGDEKKRNVVRGKAEEITVGAVKTLRLFLKEPIGIVERLIIDKADKKNLQEISDFYLSFLQNTINPQLGT